MERNLKFHVFDMPGCGRVIADLNRDDLPPVIQFENGLYCFGLPRTTDEVMPMGYESIAEGNFIHEALHMFIAAKGGFQDRSILHRAAQNADFNSDDMLRDAMDEERLVLGLQIAVNDTEGDGATTNKVGGFLMHIAAGAREFARIQLERQYGLDMDGLRGEFIQLLKASGCYNRVFERMPKLEYHNERDHLRMPNYIN